MNKILNLGARLCTALDRMNKIRRYFTLKVPSVIEPELVLINEFKYVLEGEEVKTLVVILSHCDLSKRSTITFGKKSPALVV